MSGNMNHFATLIKEIQNAPKSQRTQQLIDGIANQMKQLSPTGDVTALELSQELKQVEQQLVQACQT